MSNIIIRRRKRMRAKDIKAISEYLQDTLGVQVFTECDSIDMAESINFNVMFVDGDILAIVINGIPFLTIRGIIKYKPKNMFVTVDMGAVPFIVNGADVMGPGIVDADNNIKKGDIVWIRDVKNKAPLAIGFSLRSFDDLIARTGGKAVKNIHYVGDRLWKAGE